MDAPAPPGVPPAPAPAVPVAVPVSAPPPPPGVQVAPAGPGATRRKRSEAAALARQLPSHRAAFLYAPSAAPPTTTDATGRVVSAGMSVDATIARAVAMNVPLLTKGARRAPPPPVLGAVC